MKTAGEELEQDRLALTRAAEARKMNNLAQPIEEQTDQAIRKLVESLHASQQDRFWDWYKLTKDRLQGTKLVEQKIELLNAAAQNQDRIDLHKLSLIMAELGNK